MCGFLPPVSVSQGSEGQNLMEKEQWAAVLTQQIFASPCSFQAVLGSGTQRWAVPNSKQLQS